MIKRDRYSARLRAEWAIDRSALWNTAEAAEKRDDARVAREFEIALPHELTAAQRGGLGREFARRIGGSLWAAVDFAIHSPQKASDIRNHHAHLMMTTRVVKAEGLGDKTAIERENKWLLARGLRQLAAQLREIRQSWEQIANERLARAGLEIRIDHRSYMERGLEIEPSEHMGVHATQMERSGRRCRAHGSTASGTAQRRIDPREAGAGAVHHHWRKERIRSAGHRARAASRDRRPEAFQSAYASVMASPALVELQGERRGPDGRIIETARYSTREMVESSAGWFCRPRG